MKIIQPSFEIRRLHTREQGIELLREVDYYARLSHRSEEKQTEDSWYRVLSSAVMQKGDWSVTEHEKVTVIFRVDRGVTHELVRHRLGSYTQESTRFVNYGKRDIEFIEPVFSHQEPDVFLQWCEALEHAEIAYLHLLDSGEPPQMARSVLPNALASSIAVTYNLRNWRHFFMMRTTKETHPDFRRVTIPLLEKFQELIPLLYDDIIPNSAQSISIARAR